MKKVFYRLDNESVCADVIPFYDQGEFKLFYLNDYRNIEKHGEGCPWYLLTTKDLVHYESHGPVLLRGAETEQDLYVFTGCCIKHNDEYHIYYTGHNPHLRKKGLPEQKILRAKSKDLINWTKDKDFVFQAPDYLEPHDFRDPFIYYSETDNKYKMLLAGRLKNDNPTFTKGITLVATSTDLDHWELGKEPFYAPNAYFTHECPDLFKMGDWWYLLFSEFTDKIVTTYRMSKSPNGPWITPKVNNFDGHAFYAAKSTTDGKRRILFGWNCIKDKENDYNNWQWGGSIIPHEIVQAKDGTLYVKCPEEIKAYFNEEQVLEAKNTIGKAIVDNANIILGNEGMNIKMFEEVTPSYKLEVDFVLEDDRGDFGLILNANNNLDNYYKVKMEPKFNRLAFDIMPRKCNEMHTLVDTERYLPLELGKKHHLMIIVQESVLEVYVDDIVAMSTRMFNYQSGDLGVYAHNIGVKFSNLKIYK